MKKLFSTLAASLLLTLSAPVSAYAEEDDARFTFTLMPRVSMSAFSTRDGRSLEPSNTLLYSILQGNLTDNLSLTVQNRWAAAGWEKTKALYTNLGRADDVNFFDVCRLRLDLGDFFIQAGKESMVYGDYTFDLYAQDFFPDICDTFVAIYQPYLWGGAVGWNLNPANEFKLQVTDIPWGGIFETGKLAWTAIWTREGERFGNLCTFTLFDRPDGVLRKYIAAGHSFRSGRWYGELNVSTRFSEWAQLLDDEFTAFAQVGFSPSENLDIFSSFCWEFSHQGASEWVYGPTWNCPGSIVPMAVYPGKDLFTGSLYAYYYPLKGRSLRLHMMAAANNYAEGGTLLLGATYFLKFRF